MDNEKVFNTFDRRNKIIKNNNYCIIETVAFYDTIVFSEVIKKYYINQEVRNNKSTEKLIDNLSTSEKYDVINEIAKEKKLQPFSKNKFDIFIKERNKVAHYISATGELNIKTHEHNIFYKGEEISWSDYLDDMAKWANLSKEFADFLLSIFELVNKDLTMMNFVYCSLESKYVLIEKNLLYPEPSEEYISFFGNGLDLDLIRLINEEKKFEETL